MSDPLKILVVDDEQWALDDLLAELEARRHVKVQARTCTEARIKLSEHPEIDGAVVDVIVPVHSVDDYVDSLGSPEADATSAVIGGATLIGAIRQMRSGLPIVVFSVRRRDEVLEACPGLPADVAFFCKADEGAAREAVDRLEREIARGRRA